MAPRITRKKPTAAAAAAPAKTAEKVVANGAGRKRKASEDDAPVPAKKVATAPTTKKATPVSKVDKTTSTSTSTSTSDSAALKGKAVAKPKKTIAKATNANDKKIKAKAATTTKGKATTKSKSSDGADAIPKTVVRKRKADNVTTEKENTPDEMDVDIQDAPGETEERPTKKTKTDDETAKAKAYTAPLPKGKNAKIVRERSKKRLNVFVFGKGDMCELGLGPKQRQVTRPRLDPFLPIDTVGVVEVAVGGMHTAVLANDGSILTWGVNDQNALGRNTDWKAPEVDVDDADNSDSDSDDGDINPIESTPGPVEGLPEGVDIVTIACSDSLTAAVTSTGYVYAWGTFRVCSPFFL